MSSGCLNALVPTETAGTRKRRNLDLALSFGKKVPERNLPEIVTHGSSLTTPAEISRPRLAVDRTRFRSRTRNKRTCGSSHPQARGFRVLIRGVHSPFSPLRGHTDAKAAECHRVLRMPYFQQGRLTASTPKETVETRKSCASPGEKTYRLTIPLFTEVRPTPKIDFPSQ
jgi:hypothetical protein